MQKLSLLFMLSISPISLAVDFFQNLKLHGNVFLDFRPRWEYVDIEKDGLKTANAITSRIQFGQSLKVSPQLKFYWELTAVVPLYDHYAPLKSGYEFVADEDNFRLTQYYADYLWNGINLKLGRQVINLDNQRFIGSVNWRQMPQTFDAARVDFSPYRGIRATVAYIVSRQGVLKSLSTQPFDYKPFNHSWLVHLSFEPLKGVKTSLYSYNWKMNSDTYGVNISGNLPYGGLKFGYWGEYAHQIVHNSDSGIWDTANYYHLKLSLNTDWGNLKPFGAIGFEHLGKHFITPLATLHKFNGWADVFLKYTANTDTYGLNDAYVYAGVSHQRFGKFEAAFHRFTAPEDFPQGGNKFGNEVDLLWSKKVFKNTSLLVKYAKYNADSEASQAGVGDKDTTKFWVMLNFKFGVSF